MIYEHPVASPYGQRALFGYFSFATVTRTPGVGGRSPKHDLCARDLYRLKNRCFPGTAGTGSTGMTERLRYQ